MTATQTVGDVTLVGDKAVAPQLIRAHRSGRLVAYAVLDAYGWSVVAKTRGQMSTVDRYTPEPGGSVYGVLPYALTGLVRLAFTGRTGEE